MEIIMKVKCSPSPGDGSSSHSTLKIVDHHHQLQQHTYTTTNSPQNVISPPRTYTPNSTHHIQGVKYPIAPPPTAISPSCNDCSLGYCCNMPQCCVTTPSPQYSHTPPQIQPPPSPFPPVEQYSNNSFQSVVPDEPEFVSIDDEKVKQYLLRLGQQQLQKEKREQQLQQTEQQQTLQVIRPTKEPKITRVFTAPISSESTAKPVVYEIIELDDEDEREKLKQIKQQAEQRLANNKSFSNTTTHHVNLATRNTKSLDISLIPKSNSSPELNRTNPKQTPAASRSTKNDPSSHKIIAEIDLLESDDDDNDGYGNIDKNVGDDDAYMQDDDQDNDDNYACDDDDDETLPLAAVSCELQCDDDDDDVEENENLNASRNQSFNRNYTSTTTSQQQSQPLIRYSKPLVNDVLIVASDENKNQDDNLLVRWEEYEGQRERVFFECFLCGKKVQSSYNLRRHMMIHTGERPFGCDLCDRRFREFSDLKKHRRRHSNESNYLCMVCQKQKPVEIDPTRCKNCCTQSKNAVIMAAMKPATEADLAAQNRARIKAATEAKLAQTTSAALKAKSTQVTHQMPTIASVTSYNVAAKNSQTTTATTVVLAPASKSPETNGSVNTTASPKANEKTQRLLDNIPAVHRPGYNELGMITRKEFPCPLCNRAFGTRHNLKRHYMIHTGEKPFSCSKCRKPFREFSTLKKHMVTHMRERWYKCAHCTSKFRDFLKYTEHKETHINDNVAEEPAVKKTFANMQNDNYMMDSNDEESGAEDWLECCECGQRFNEIDAYNNHLKEHDVNNQIFECYICKEHMKTRTDLDKHLRLQHKHEIENDMNNDDDDDNDDDNDDDDDDDYDIDNEEEFISI